MDFDIMFPVMKEVLLYKGFAGIVILALATVFSVVADANNLVDKKAPFKLVKEDPKAAKEVLSQLADMIRFVGRSLLPIMPQTAEEILRRYGKLVLMGDPLFPRRDTPGS